MLLRGAENRSTSERRDLREIADASRRLAHTISTLLDAARTQSTMPASGHSQLVTVVDEALADLQAATMKPALPT